MIEKKLICLVKWNNSHFWVFQIDANNIIFSVAGKFRRTSGPTYARPNDTWEHLAMGLCLPSGTSLPTTSSFYSNFASVSKSDHAFCSRLQPTNDDYKVEQKPSPNLHGPSNSTYDRPPWTWFLIQIQQSALNLTFLG